MYTLDKFSTVVEQYKVVFFDAFGVLKSYNGLIPGIIETFEYLKATDIEYYIVTNDASRSPMQLAQAYHRLGLHAVDQERIISSGMIAKEYLDLKVNDGIVAYLGTEDSAHYIERSGLQALPVGAINDNNIDQVNAVVLLDDEGFDWFNDINRTVNILRQRTIPAIVANTDNIYPVSGSNNVSIAIGGIAKMIESIVGKKFIRFGKPDSQMFMFAYDQIRARRSISKKEILMVGDTLHTDIIGGNKFGIDTVLVLSGNTRPGDAATRISSTGIVPTYVCQEAVIC
jgi:HAD superfamily hydrolase (TIGR01450 family)